MRRPIFVLAAASLWLAGCSSCCNSPCQPCKKPCAAPCAAPARAPCALGSSLSSPTPYAGAYAPKLTPPPAIAVTPAPARGSFRLPELGAPSYAYAPARPVATTVRSTPPPIAARPSVARSAPASAVLVSSPAAVAPRVAAYSAPAAIVPPAPAAAPKTVECEDCSDGHCGVPPPR